MQREVHEAGGQRLLRDELAGRNARNPGNADQAALDFYFDVIAGAE